MKERRAGEEGRRRGVEEEGEVRMRGMGGDLVNTLQARRLTFQYPISSRCVLDPRESGASQYHSESVNLGLEMPFWL